MISLNDILEEKIEVDIRISKLYEESFRSKGIQIDPVLQNVSKVLITSLTEYSKSLGSIIETLHSTK